MPPGLVTSSASLPAPAGWAIVNEAPETEKVDNAVYIEIGKSRIAARPGVDPEHLSKVCRVLIELC